MTDYTKYVNPLIGNNGHLLQSTAPNVQSPHGQAVITPVGRSGMKDRYNSDKIFGFTAGSIIIMPTVLSEQPDYDQTASVFDHDFETAAPDCYTVLLEDSGIQERHTAFRNYGMFEFQYPENTPACVALYSGRNQFIHVENGCVTLASTVGFYENVTEYVTFSIPQDAKVTEYDISKSENNDKTGKTQEKAVLIRFASKHICLPFALSDVSEEVVLQSFSHEVAGKTFDEIRSACNSAWNHVLGKIRVEGGTESRKRVFYTALYRALCRMHNHTVCGKYHGYDGKSHDAEGWEFYCDDGLWDTFRAMHGLQLILEPNIHKNILKSYLQMYRESGWLPRFPFPGGDLPCMLGFHSASLMAESMVKGVDFDWKTAYEAAKKNATQRSMLPWRNGETGELTNCYYENGFFPALQENEQETCSRVHPFEGRQAAAVTIEHSYDDWCVSKMAEMLGNSEDAAFFRKRSQNYRQLWDADIGFIHPKTADGSYVEPYNPKYCGGQGGRRYFAENNAYIYNFAAQHDIAGTVELMGGKKAFAEKLDNLFVEQYDNKLKSTFLNQYPDATGLIGQFCMGNEPSFHIPYLYNYCGQAYKTQRKIHELIDLWFTDSPFGICGDEDGGAMSSFLAFSAMGFYPVNPASGTYDLGSPIFDQIELDLPNGKTFTVRAQGAGGKAKYIQRASINNSPLSQPKFTHAQMMEGGELILEMGERPNKALFSDGNDTVLS